MKLRYFIILQIVIQSCLSAQNSPAILKYGIIGKLNFLTDTLKVKDNDVKNVLKNIFSQSDPSVVEFELFYAQNETFFTFSNATQLSQKDLDLNIYKITAKNTGEIYTNLITGEVLQSRFTYGKNLIIQSNLNSPKWNLTNQTKIIGDYTCLKAFKEIEFFGNDGIKKITVEAWYSPKIPLPTGPMGFGGLPGLIVELEYANFVYYLKSLSMNLDDALNIKKPTKGELLSYHDYIKFLMKMEEKENEDYLDKN